MDMIERIRNLHSRDMKSERKISRTTRLLSNTVDQSQEAQKPRYKRDTKPTKPSAYEQMLKMTSKADAGRPKKERRMTEALYLRHMVEFAQDNSLVPAQKLQQRRPSRAQASWPRHPCPAAQAHANDHQNAGHLVNAFCVTPSVGCYTMYPRDEA